MLEVTVRFSASPSCSPEFQPFPRSHVSQLLTPENITDLENSSLVAHFLTLSVNISRLVMLARWAGPGTRAWDGCALEQVIPWVGLEDPQKEKLQAEERWKSVLLCSVTNLKQIACSLCAQNSPGLLAWVSKAQGNGELSAVNGGHSCLRVPGGFPIFPKNPFLCRGHWPPSHPVHTSGCPHGLEDQEPHSGSEQDPDSLGLDWHPRCGSQHPPLLSSLWWVWPLLFMLATVTIQ